MASVAAIVAVGGIVVLLLCLAGAWYFFGDAVSSPAKCAYSKTLGRPGRLVRLTETSASDPNVKIFADDMDGFMIETNASAASKSSYYPAIIVTNAGSTYQLKTSATAEPLVHNQMAGVTDLWDWGKGVCHLVVWAGGLMSNVTSDPLYDWRANMTTQLVNLQNTVSNLPNMKTILEGYDGLVVDDAQSTTMPPIVLSTSPDTYIAAATVILRITKEFILARLAANSLVRADVDEYIKRVSGEVTWLMWATNDVPINRVTRALFQWKKEMSEEEWAKLYVVIGTGVADATSVVTPRGSCTSGNTAAQIFSHLMSSDHFASRVAIYSGDTLDFDVLPAVLNPQNISATIASNFGSSTYSRMIRADLIQPNNALSTHFTYYTAKNVVGACSSSRFTGEQCKLAPASTEQAS